MNRMAKHDIMKGKEEGGTGLSKGWQAASRNFLRAALPAKVNFKRQHCQPKENPVPPDSVLIEVCQT